MEVRCSCAVKTGHGHGRHRVEFRQARKSAMQDWDARLGATQEKTGRDSGGGQLPKRGANSEQMFPSKSSRSAKCSERTRAASPAAEKNPTPPEGSRLSLKASTYWPLMCVTK